MLDPLILMVDFPHGDPEHDFRFRILCGYNKAYFSDFSRFGREKRGVGPGNSPDVMRRLFDFLRFPVYLITCIHSQEVISKVMAGGFEKDL